MGEIKAESLSCPVPPTTPQGPKVDQGRLSPTQGGGFGLSIEWVTCALGASFSTARSVGAAEGRKNGRDGKSQRCSQRNGRWQRMTILKSSGRI